MEPLDLGDRRLWPDGDLTVDPSKITDFIFKIGSDLSKLKVSSITQEIEDYNKISSFKISTKDTWDSSIFPPRWTIPDKYQKLDLDDYLFRLVDKIEKDDLYENRLVRFSEEIYLFKSLKLDDLLRVLIYIIDTFISNKIVWGVGRGSSCSSYLLFLLGLHSIDCVKYEIDISDFLKI